ncbi:MAG: penicillin-insensitive murein endopeptidase [Gaiella sp.]
MGWRRGELWLETDVLWFREAGRAGGVVAVAAPGLVGLGPDPALTEPIANGLAESRRRRAERRRRESARKTRAAALVLGPAVALSLAGSRVASGGEAGGALAEDPPSLTFRLGASASAGVAPGGTAPPGVRGTAGRAVPPSAAIERSSAPSRADAFAPIRWSSATSTGLPYGGSLAGGTQLPVIGPDWVTWNPVTDQRPNAPYRLFGHERTIRAIVSVLAAHRAAHPDAPQVVVGDISLRDGGPMNEHRSHQNGLDVDVYYPRLDRALRPPFTTDQVDRVLAQDLLDRFLAAGARIVFVGYSTGLRGPAGVVVPYANHENHMHVRFAAP